MAKADKAQQELDFDPEGLTEEEIGALSGEIETEGEEISAPPEEVSDAEREANEAVQKAAEKPEGEAGDDPKSAKDSTEKPPEGYVKHEAMYAERKRRQEIEQKMRERDEILASLAERLKGVKDQPDPQPRKQAAPEEPIDFLEDPEGAYNQALRQINELRSGFQGIQQKEQQAEQQRQQMTQQQQLEASLVNEYNETLKEDPQLDDAVNHVVKTLETEYDRLGYASSGLSKPDFVKQSVFQHSVYARQTGTPVGQYLRNLAYSRGWDDSSAPEGKDPGPSEGEKKVKSLQEAQKRTRTISRGSSGDSGEFTLDTIDKMSPAELERFMSKDENAALVDKLLADYEAQFAG